MKEILIATDFSEQSDLAIKVAQKLKKHIPSKAFHWDNIIHKLKSVISSEDDLYYKVSEWGSKAPAHLREEIEGQFKRLGLTNKDLAIEFVEGGKFNALQDYFKGKSEEDLVMITTSDDTLWERVLFGNFVEKLIFGTKNPVYLVKRDIEHPPKKIAICFDPEQDGQRFLYHAAKIAKTFGATVEIIYVEAFDSRDLHKNIFSTNQDTEKNKNNYLAYKRKLAEEKFEEYEAFFKKQGVESAVKIILAVDKTPAENVINHLHKNPVDLLMVEPSQGFTKGFKFNSTSYDLIKNVPVNFIIVKEDHKLGAKE